MLKPPPAAGSKRPGDVFELLREAGRAAGLSRRDLMDIFRLMTMSVGDLLDDFFETDELKGAYASSGVVGVWAGPYTPGTAYNLLHHALGEVDGVQGAWGHVRGGMGAISNAIAASARAAGASIRTGAPVASIDVDNGRVTGVTLVSGETIKRADRPLGRAPQAHRARPRRRRALPRRGRRRHAPLPQPRGLGEDQRGPLRAAALRQRTRRRQRAAPARERRDRAVGALSRARVAGRHARPPRRGPVHRGRGAHLDRPVADRRRHDRADDVHAVRPARRRGLARRARARPTPSAASTSSPSTRPTSATRSSTTRCSRRPTWR